MPLPPGGYPPGVLPRDLDRGVTRLDDLPPPDLWAGLDPDRQTAVYRQFFHARWQDLADCLDAAGRDAELGKEVREVWERYRDRAVGQMELRGGEP